MALSGGRAFDRERFVALADYCATNGGAVGSTKLALLMFRIDFAAYWASGQSLTGATYLRGERHPEVREVGVGWFERFIRMRSPWWTRPLAWALTARAVLGMLRCGGPR